MQSVTDSHNDFYAEDVLDQLKRQSTFFARSDQKNKSFLYVGWKLLTFKRLDAIFHYGEWRMLERSVV